MILAFSVPAQERLQVCVGDSENTIEPVGYKLSRVDPAANGPHRDSQRFGDVGDGEKSHAVCRVAPRKVASDQSAKMISRGLASGAVRFLMHG